eukprot:4896091-Pyramimonas_sp.AAC.1
MHVGIHEAQRFRGVPGTAYGPSAASKDSQGPVARRVNRETRQHVERIIFRAPRGLRQRPCQRDGTIHSTSERATIAAADDGPSRTAQATMLGKKEAVRKKTPPRRAIQACVPRSGYDPPRGYHDPER